MSERLSAHFTREEFACRDGCGFNAIDSRLVNGLELLRLQLGRPVEVLSGCRCPKHNAAVGGEPDSQHLLGKAADIRVGGMPARELYAAAVKVVQFRGFGVDDERGFVHVDVRLVGARWCYRGGRQVAWYEVNG
jgi:uncharacterized protein YcbK (DUF882 family)